MNEIIVALDASLFATLTTLYFLKPFALGLVTDPAFSAPVFDHPFAYAPRQRDPQILPCLYVT